MYYNHTLVIPHILLYNTYTERAELIFGLGGFHYFHDW